MQCIRCGSAEAMTSEALGVCRGCILEDRPELEARFEDLHGKIREKTRLPFCPPRSRKAHMCRICYRACRPAPGEKGYCGLRENRDGRLVHLAGTPKKGLLDCYHDLLPTNCVSQWACRARGREYLGKKNLAVFYGACTLNCLFCQNWQYRTLTGELKPLYTAQELADRVDKQTACICFFGGDPAPQVPHALAAVRRALKKNPDLIVCWETSGLMRKSFLERMIAYSFATGGTLKFDLKAYHRSLYYALTGGDNRPVLKNFARCARLSRQKGVSLAVASTLLVPGYIEEEEVYAIASFIAAHNPDTPYSLLGFFPQFQMRDLRPTRRSHAEACLKAARQAGLKRVKLGNLSLLL